MPRFPESESEPEIVAVAALGVEGIEQAPENFPAPPKSGLADVSDG